MPLTGNIIYIYELDFNLDEIIACVWVNACLPGVPRVLNWLEPLAFTRRAGLI